MTQGLTFVMGGRVLGEHETRARLAQDSKPKVRAEGSATWHKGFSVEGWPAGFIDEQERLTQVAIAGWTR